MDRRQAHGPRRLAVRAALVRRLDAVVDRVADRVDERFEQLLDHGLVDLSSRR
jgi:hypothetical protein